jgi:hypothetical protein
VAIVVGTPQVSDNCGTTPPVPVRSDNANLTLNDPFPAGTTTITWTETDIHGNFVIATQSVTVSQTPTTPVVTANGPTTFCQGGSVTLSFIDNNSGYTYQWYRNGVAINSQTG